MCKAPLADILFKHVADFLNKNYFINKAVVVGRLK